MKLKIFFIFVISCSLALVKSDIPTHCLQHQIFGEWEFYQTEPKEMQIPELYQHKCGITDHTKVSEIHKFNMDKSLFKNSFKINLNREHVAKVTHSFAGFKGSKKGKWTMVYDEGFEFNLGKKDTKDFSSYFIFLKYSPNNGSLPGVKSKHYSHCYETLIGWFYTQNNKWGCFYGHKLVDDYSKPTNGEASDKLIVLENSVKAASFIQKNEKEENLDSIFNSIGSERFMQTETSSKLKNKVESHAAITFKNEIELTNEYTNHAEVVSRINALNLGWKAAVYDEFKGLSVKDLNRLSGRVSKGGHYTRHYSENRFHTRKETFSSHERKQSKKLSKKSSTENKKKGLKEIDYTKFMGPPKRQGNCGSCFAVATNTMIEARLRMKYQNIIQKYYHPQLFKISLDHVLKCSYYNQGCHGGYSYLVSKFFKEYEIMAEDCFDPSNCSNKCVANNTKNGKLRIKVDDYYYVGQYYGYTTEENIYEDLMKHGPLVISLAPNYLFSSYKTGIFDADANTWKQLNVKQPEWQKVDHSVVLVGYGVHEGVEYWLIQNSWGENWGEKGYMKLRKGKNLINIESLGEAALVSLTEDGSSDE